MREWAGRDCFSESQCRREGASGKTEGKSNRHVEGYFMEKSLSILPDNVEVIDLVG